MSSVDELKKSLQGEFDNARRRLQSALDAAEERDRKLQARYQQFLKSAERVRTILTPRVAAFEASLKGAHKSVTRLDIGSGEKQDQGTVVAFQFPHTEECPAYLALRFELSHDESIENLLLTYDLEMMPIFIQFKKHDELASPVDRLDEPAITDWFDRCAVEFTRTFVEMQFNPQYQRENLAKDVVLGLIFPKVFSAGKVESNGVTYHFFSEDSLRQFQKAPERYTAKQAVAAAAK
jgi:YHS domain-containing protein